MTRINHEKLNKQKKAGPRGERFDIEKYVKRKVKKRNKTVRSYGVRCNRCGCWIPKGIAAKLLLSGAIICIPRCQKTK